VILVTVGTQLPFDRLIRIVDAAAPTLAEPVIGQTGAGRYRPVHMEAHATMDPAAFEVLLQQARVIVAHAGIGTVLMAQKHRRPIILFPRDAALGEHRNDHQAATVSALEDRPGIYVARDGQQLLALLDRRLEPPPRVVANPMLDRLNGALRDYIART
jgi:UDP-N-acetylglucosamine transferase subunit ALG13